MNITNKSVMIGISAYTVCSSRFSCINDGVRYGYDTKTSNNMPVMVRVRAMNTARFLRNFIEMESM
jgi:hypothetical protein